MDKYTFALKAIHEMTQESIALEEVRDNLWGLRDEIEILLESIEIDIENKEEKR